MAKSHKSGGDGEDYVNEPTEMSVANRVCGVMKSHNKPPWQVVEKQKKQPVNWLFLTWWGRWDLNPHT